MKKTVATAIASLTLGVMLAAPVYAADDANKNDPDAITLQKIRSDKKYVVSQNMQLTDAEAAAFWPVYEDYQTSLHKLNGRTVDLIKEYADMYNSQTITDASATKLLDKQTEIETEELALKKSIIAKLRKVLPGVKVTRFIQIENKLRLIIKSQFAKEIPLIGGEKK